MKKTIFLLITLALVCPLAIQANTDDDKQMELERRVELLQKEVNEIRRNLESPRDKVESNYILSVISRVKKNWFFPEDLDVKIDDFLRVAIEINRDGTINDQEIIKSSNNEQFNSYALECISKSTPLPPLPVEMKKEIVKVELRFRPPQN